jgi:hypothetical protein
MEIHINGPPGHLRPHVRQRRLAMMGVWASHQRQLKRSERQRCDLEEAYARLAAEVERQRRGDDALDHLGNLVAALLSADFRPALTLAIEPARIMGAGETENRK